MGITTEKSLRGCVESIEQRDGDRDEISFEVIDLGEVYRQHVRWKATLPRIQPYYGISSLYSVVARPFSLDHNGNLSSSEMQSRSSGLSFPGVSGRGLQLFL